MNPETLAVRVCTLLVAVYGIRMAAATLSKWFVAQVTIAHQNHFTAHVERQLYESSCEDADIDVYIEDDDD